MTTTTYQATGEPVLVVPCTRCGGKGYIPRFGHVLKGVCFECNGATVRPLSRRNHASIFASLNRFARAIRI